MLMITGFIVGVGDLLTDGGLTARHHRWRSHRRSLGTRMGVHHLGLGRRVADRLCPTAVQSNQRGYGIGVIVARLLPGGRGKFRHTAKYRPTTSAAMNASVVRPTHLMNCIVAESATP